MESKPTIEIKVMWESNTSLSVSYPKNAQVLLKESSVVGVTVKYEVTP
jgi:hypothetical protein